MSRIGKRVLTIPSNVNVSVENNVVTVSGPKGTLNLDLIKTIQVNVNGTELTVEKLKDDKFTNQMHGTTNANIANMLTGGSEGYKKGLEKSLFPMLHLPFPVINSFLPTLLFFSNTKTSNSGLFIFSFIASTNPLAPAPTINIFTSITFDLH